jgi:hypothetical protein
MFGVYPPLEVVETKKVQHHLRYMDAGANNAEAGMANEAVKTPQDIVQERRRAKAMKVSSCIIECCGGWEYFMNSTMSSYWMPRWPNYQMKMMDGMTRRKNLMRRR